ncbi:Uncharacterised protein [Corynebacterium pseudotuberculosis]|nr:hypothetical protein C8E98_1748 [Corynebacterium pseudotuberculosis]VTQ74605.1 Uncharacterised protein [Corynebacterium pseudotuberculosis]
MRLCEPAALFVPLMTKVVRCEYKEASDNLGTEGRA